MEIADYSRFFFALLFVVTLIWGTAAGAKKLGLDKKIRGVTDGKGRLQMREVLYLDPKRKVMLVRADDTDYLLALSGDQVQLIDKLEAKRDAAV